MMNRMVPAVIERASMVVSMNPLDPNPQAQAVEVGTPLRDLAPATQSPLMLRVNGQWLLRADWWRPVLPGDVIEWHVLPMGGGNGSRTLLQAVIVVAALVYGYYTGDYAGAFRYASAALALTNALIPIQQPKLGTPQSPGAVYNVSTAANQARLNQPIPVIYGRMLTFPDYAAQPYVEYDTHNNQFFYAVYCIGQGNYNVERLQIENTQINYYQDVQYEILPPGVQPTIAQANVVTSHEVLGQTMLTAQPIGGFAATAPQFFASAIGIDLVFPKGLGYADTSGNLLALSAQFRLEARPINDFGVATSDWYVLASETITAAQTTPLRISRKYTLPTGSITAFDGAFGIGGIGARVLVRITRLDTINTYYTALHDMTWAGLRAYLTAPAPLAPSATHMALRIRATEQLSGMSQRRVSGIWRRKVRTWAAGVWGPEVETRNPMWARLDKLTNAVYGDGLPDARIDLQSHADLAAVYDARQDHFDILFDSKITSIDADRTICMAGRAVPFQRAGVCTVVRDQLQTLPVTAFTSRDIVPGSMSIGYALATEVTADAVIIEYFDNHTWIWTEIKCNAPGVTTPVNAVRQRVMGITGATHAQREGLYMAAQNVYRRKFPKFTTEMQGLLPAYGAAALFHPAMPGWGQTGDVAFWNPATLTMGLTEPAAFTSGAQHFVSLLRDDGSVTPAIAVTPGPTANDLVLASAPLLADGVTLMTLVLDDANRERPKFVFGAQGQHRIMVRVLGIRKAGRGKDGAQSIEISTVAEDVRVHAVDNALLPGPGVIQDSVDTATVALGAPFSTIVNIDAISNAALSSSVGVKVSGLDPNAIYLLDMPVGAGRFTGWSFVSNDYESHVASPPNAWGNLFQVTRDDSSTASFGVVQGYPDGPSAQAAFAGGSVTGSTSYTFWISDIRPADNRGGLSIRITKQLSY